MSDDFKITGNPSATQPMTYKGIDVATSSDLIGEAKLPGVRLWGHRINLSGEDGIECEECEMREEIPDILQMSSGFREVIYKLYILGKFKNTRCEPEFETDQSVLNHNVTSGGHTTTTTNTKHKIKLDDGYVIAGGGTIYESSSPRYTTGQMLTDREWMNLVQEAGPDINSLSDSISDMGDSMRSAGHSIGDMTMTVDKSTHEDLKKDASWSDPRSSTNTSVQIEGDVDEKSMKEKFASALCERAGLR